MVVSFQSVPACLGLATLAPHASIHALAAVDASMGRSYGAEAPPIA